MVFATNGEVVVPELAEEVVVLISISSVLGFVFPWMSYETYWIVEDDTGAANEQIVEEAVRMAA